MKKKKDWGAINASIAAALLGASLFCYFTPGLFETGIIFLILGIIATYFAAIT